MKKSFFFCACALCTVYAAVHPQIDVSIPGSQKTMSAHPLDMLIEARRERPLVSDIQALLTDDAVVLSWKINPAITEVIKELLVFRSDERIQSVDDPANTRDEKQKARPVCAAVLKPENTVYTDKDLAPGKSRYYAVAIRQNDGTLYDLIVPSENATVEPCVVPHKRISEKADAQKQIQSADKNPKSGTEKNEKRSPAITQTPPVLREKPLPELRLSAQNAGAGARKKDKGLQTAPAKNETTAIPPADILPEELEDTHLSGDDYVLFSIVNEYVKTEDWHNAEEKLSTFLQVNRSEKASARASFYLGQALYFNGKYREALQRFQKSQKLYPLASKPWSTRVLDAYRID